MLKSLTVDNFKIHRRLKIQLGSLTVLTGMNSSGKSSIIQSLLLLRQGFLQGTLNDGLGLNGDLLSIGLCQDILCQDAEDDFISFGLQSEEGLSQWKWDASDGIMGKDFLPVMESPQKELWKDCALFSHDFQYIGAARQEPSESYPLNSNAVESKKQLSLKYGRCELTAHFLYHYGKEKKLLVRPGLIHASGEDPDLLSQVSFWEQVISPDVKVEPLRGDKSYSLKYAYQIGGDTSLSFSAVNVGFGLSYALPIVVSLLAADEGSLILIENPEAHLHESAQSELGVMIARAAQAGVQVIVETHSIHVMNGILKASKSFEKGDPGIDRNLVKMYYLKRVPDGLYSQCDEIRIVGDGRIDHQPDGFFNRIDSDLSFLLGF